MNCIKYDIYIKCIKYIKYDNIDIYYHQYIYADAIHVQDRAINKISLMHV